MNNDQIIRILREASLSMNHDFDATNLRFVEINNRSYDVKEFPEFKRDLLEAGSKIRMLFLEYALEQSDLESFIKKENSPILLFQRDENSITPVLLTKIQSKGQLTILNEDSSLEEPYGIDSTKRRFVASKS